MDHEISKLDFSYMDTITMASDEEGNGQTIYTKIKHCTVVTLDERKADDAPDYYGHPRHDNTMLRHEMAFGRLKTTPLTGPQSGKAHFVSGRVR